MKPIKQLTPNFSVSGQVGPEDIGTLASKGVKVLINNRPDREEIGQVTHNQLAAEAKLHKMAYFHIPVVSGQITPQSIEMFAEVLNTLPGPILAFCRSGTRSATMWALAKAPSMDIDEIMKITSAAGYDLSELKPELESLHPSASRKQSYS